MSRTSEELQLTAFTTVPVSDIEGMSLGGMHFYVELDAPKNTPFKGRLLPDIVGCEFKSDRSFWQCLCCGSGDPD